MIRLSVCGTYVPFSSWEFPGGEVGVKLLSSIERHWPVIIVADGIVSCKDIFVLMHLAAAVHEMKGTHEGTTVYMPYVPYARQDRICHEGENFALKSFIQMIKPLENLIAEMTIVDPHSQVTVNLINELTNIKLYVHAQHHIAFYYAQMPNKYDFVIAPDKGAIEKSKKYLPEVEHVFLNKRREGSKIIYEDYPKDGIHGRAIVVDDLVDAGGTFISLGRMLRETQPNLTSLDLYVTHGIFSKGLDSLYEVFDNVYCFNNMNNHSFERNKNEG